MESKAATYGVDDEFDESISQRNQPIDFLDRSRDHPYTFVLDADAPVATIGTSRINEVVTSSRKEYRMGDRIPRESPFPLMFERRVTLDDIRGFQITISPDRSYGQIISFDFGERTTKIGGIISVVPQVSGPRPWTCESLLYDGKCQCAGRKLPPHAEQPFKIPTAGLIGILHKFLINHNGNTFHPGELSDVHIDAVLLRCAVHAIAQLLGVKTINAPVSIGLGAFSDVVEPKNLNAAMENYYKNRGDENPKAVARGLWIAVATHFVSS